MAGVPQEGHAFGPQCSQQQGGPAAQDVVFGGYEKPYEVAAVVQSWQGGSVQGCAAVHIKCTPGGAASCPQGGKALGAGKAAGKQVVVDLAGGVGSQQHGGSQGRGIGGKGGPGVGAKRLPAAQRPGGASGQRDGGILAGNIHARRLQKSRKAA